MQDLTNPFVGRYKIRRTTTTAVLVKIRSEIVSVRGIWVVVIVLTPSQRDASPPFFYSINLLIDGHIEMAYIDIHTLFYFIFPVCDAKKEGTKYCSFLQHQCTRIFALFTGTLPRHTA